MPDPLTVEIENMAKLHRSEWTHTQKEENSKYVEEQIMP